MRVSFFRTLAAAAAAVVAAANDSHNHNASTVDPLRLFYSLYTAGNCTQMDDYLADSFQYFVSDYDDASGTASSSAPLLWTKTNWSSVGCKQLNGAGVAFYKNDVALGERQQANVYGVVYHQSRFAKAGDTPCLVPYSSVVHVRAGGLGGTIQEVSESLELGRTSALEARCASNSTLPVPSDAPGQVDPLVFAAQVGARVCVCTVVDVCGWVRCVRSVVFQSFAAA
jgi:hypothetical protein